MGVLLMNHLRASEGVVTSVFGLLFLFEGLVLLYMALRSPTAQSRRILSVIGVVDAGIGLVISTRLVDEPLGWAGVFVGLKLMTFGGTLIWIAWRALRSDSSLVYEAVTPTPEVGGLYAVYFGTAFHLGVFIGDGEVVNYLNDDHVYRVTWDEFLRGRIPEHWTYPDLAPVPAEVVVRTALAEVGKTYPYKLLTCNCEHFAVFCKSGGTTRHSRYAQIAGGVAGVQTHPFLGTIAELNTRIVEWLAFHFGGPSGKRISLAIRRIGAVVTNWLVTSGGREETRLPDEDSRPMR
jgi:Lecithin retinol acyltransferase